MTTHTVDSGSTFIAKGGSQFAHNDELTGLAKIHHVGLQGDHEISHAMITDLIEQSKWTEGGRDTVSLLSFKSKGRSDVSLADIQEFADYAVGVILASELLSMSNSEALRLEWPLLVASGKLSGISAEMKDYAIACIKREEAPSGGQGVS